MTIEELKLISNLVAIAAAIAAWFFVKWIEKRLGCKNDWELIALEHFSSRCTLYLLWTSRHIKNGEGLFE
jgi:hypothetical protein